MSDLKDDLDVWKHRCGFIQGQTLAILKHSSLPFILLLSLSSPPNMSINPLLPISQTIWLELVVSLYSLTKDLKSLSERIDLITIYELQRYNTYSTYEYIFSRKNTGEKSVTFLIPFLLVIAAITTMLL